MRHVVGGCCVSACVSAHVCASTLAHPFQPCISSAALGQQPAAARQPDMHSRAAAAHHQHPAASVGSNVSRFCREAPGTPCMALEGACVACGSVRGGLAVGRWPWAGGSPRCRRIVAWRGAWQSAEAEEQAEQLLDGCRALAALEEGYGQAWHAQPVGGRGFRGLGGFCVGEATVVGARGDCARGWPRHPTSGPCQVQAAVVLTGAINRGLPPGHAVAIGGPCCPRAH